MTQMKEDLLYFWKKKSFTTAFVLMTVLTFATQLMEPTIGIDDTSFKLYFVDGVAPAVGRWCIYLINKILPLKYNPYFVELFGIILLMISVSLWCVVFRRIFQDKIPVLGYIAFACVMISCPMQAELEVWYLQNGSHMAYGITALAVLLILQSLEKNRTFKEEHWKYVRLVLGSSILLTIANGCYESFMIVYVIGVLLSYLAILISDAGKYSKNILRWMKNGFIIVGVSIILRSIIVFAITVIYQLEDQKNVLQVKGVGYIIQQLLNMQGENEGIKQLIKEYIVKYYLNGIAYTPVMILALGMFTVVLIGIGYAILRKNWLISVTTLGIVITPVLLCLAEGQVSFYRSAQYAGLVTAFAVLLLFWVFREKRSATFRYIGYACLLILLYRQGYEMNHWMYVDAMKYEDDKRVMNSVGGYIQENLDASLPICVVGEYENDKSLLEDVYLQSWSKKYTILETLVNAIDPDIFEKYNTPYGYAAAETPQLSMIKWGATAFYGFDRELIAFWKMHGFTFTEDGNLSHYEEAKTLMENGPVWPQKGAIVQMDDYIIVNFGYSD